MPVEVTEAVLRDALALIGEWDHDGAQSARVALESLGWPDSGPLLVRLYDIQLFVWYTLPRKFITELEHKHAVAEALARLLEQLGGRAAGYAAVCRSPETSDLLQAWEDEDPGAWHQFRRLLNQSGLEPPDTPLLAWGKIMGFVEASAREQVVTALECAVDTETLIPGARGFKRLQAQTAEDALREPLDGGDGETRLEAIHAERLADWHARGIAQGGEHRRAILEPIASLLDGPPAAIDPDAAHTAVVPAIWLLELGVDGIALTQTGAINRATVRDAAERWSGWWDGGLHGPPHQEAEVVLLSALLQQLRDLKLLRRSGRRLLTTNRGRGLATEPAQLISALAGDLLAGNDFRAACAELSVALLLTGFDADWSDPLAQAIGPAIVEGGWRSSGEPPSTRDISWTISDFIRPATAAGLLEIRDLSGRRQDPLILTAAGRLALMTALRNRATGPRPSPY